MCVGVLRDGRSYQPSRERGNVADGKPGRLAAGGPGRGNRMLGAGQEGPRLGAEGPPCSRELDPSGVPLHEACADPFLELADLSAPRLLGEVESLRRAREVELLG